MWRMLRHRSRVPGGFPRVEFRCVCGRSHKSGVCSATGTGNGEGRDGGEHQALVGITATARLVPGGASSEAICFAAAGAHARKGGGWGSGGR